MLINDLAGYGKVALSAILTGKMLDGCSLRASTAKAMDAVRELIIRNRGNEDKFKGSR